jgi:Domain of unknown function (DUF4326)
MTRVVNCKKEFYDVPIDRTTKWGNPYAIGNLYGTREEVIEKYRRYLYDSGLINDIEELRDKILGCWCAPRPCHGDVLVSILNDNGGDLQNNLSHNE